MKRKRDTCRDRERREIYRKRETVKGERNIEKERERHREWGRLICENLR